MEDKGNVTTWNYRVLADEYKGDIYLSIREVYYTNGIPDGYTKGASAFGSESIGGLQDALTKQQEALVKPILWMGDKFPQEYKNQHEKVEPKTMEE